MKWLLSRNRFALYAMLGAALLVATAAAVWLVAGTGAYLTDEGDWQTLDGQWNYQIGVIDYVVNLNGEKAMGQNDAGGDASAYRLAIPVQGAVRMFDSTLTGATAATLREKEFNEGATLIRVQVVNCSDSMVEVTAQFTLSPEAGAHFRLIDLPVDLTLDQAKNLSYRTYVLNTLKLANPPITDLASETEALTQLGSLYAQAYPNGALPDQYVGLIDGSLGGATPPTERKDFVEINGRYCFYKEVYLLVWSEYGSGEYNVEGADAPSRWGQMTGTFTVGNLE